VAALVVALYHMRRPLNEMGLGDSVLVERGYRMLQHGYLGVDLFFVLSGFVLAMSYADRFQNEPIRVVMPGFMLRRFFRIYPLYGATLVAAAAAAWFGPGLAIVPEAEWGTTFVSNLLLAQGWLAQVSFNAPAWSLSVEWGAYLAFPAVIAAVFARSPWRAAVLPGVALVALLVLGLAPSTLVAWRNGPFDIDENGHPIIVWLACPLRGMAGFVLGAWGFRVVGHGMVRRLGGSGGILAGVAGAIAVLMAGYRTDVAIVLLFVPLIWCLHHHAGLADRAFGNPVIRWLGDISYSIYLLQMPLVFLYHHLVAAFAIPFGAADMALWAAHMAALLGCAHVSWKWIEQPGSALGRRLQRGLAAGGLSRPVLASRPAPLPSAPASSSSRRSSE
jgi:peptidoglycan/LPS O-acetylase OafA/YrhL